MLLDAGKTRQLRLANGWTQDQLAQLCGVSVRTIQRIEKTGVASLETSSALAAVMKIDREAILAQGGVQPARSEFSLRNVIVISGLTFLFGLGVGYLV